MYTDIKIDWKNWKQEITTHFNITYVTSLPEIKKLIQNKGILCSRCSKVKTLKKEAMPSEFYLSKTNINFYKWCTYWKFSYAILSDKYGLHWWDELLATYDIHPSTLQEEDFIQLADKIKEKMIDREYTSFIFFNSSPKMSKPYFYMMYLTGLPIYYISKLHVPKIKLY